MAFLFHIGPPDRYVGFAAQLEVVAAWGEIRLGAGRPAKV